MFVEPPLAELPARRTPGVRALTPFRAGDLRVAVATAATALAVTASGDVFVLAALLAAVSASRVAAAGVLLAAGAVLGRWGTGALAAVAGGQAVLGSAVTVGPPAAGAAAATAALALLLAAPGPDGTRVGALLMVPFAAAAARVAAGPAAVSLEGAAIRVGATAAALALGYATTRWIPATGRHVAAVVAGAAAAVLAMVA